MPELGTSAAALVDDLTAGTRVLGWSEGVHNKAEYLGVRNAVVVHLARRGWLRLLALETSFARSRAADAYLGGASPDEPDPATVHGVWSWSREPLHDNLVLLRWLRRHNASVPPERRVRLAGLDMFGGADSAPPPDPSGSANFAPVADLPGSAGSASAPDPDDERIAAGHRDRLAQHRAAGGDHRDVGVRDGVQYATLAALAGRFPGAGVLVFEQLEHLDRRIAGSLGEHLARGEVGPFRAVAAVWRDGEPGVRYPLGPFRGLSRWTAARQDRLALAPLGTGLADLRGSRSPTAAAFDAALFAPALSVARPLGP